MALVIGGHYRSGTTLIATLCDRHPDMRMTFEFRCFVGINTSYRRHMQHLRKNWYVRGMLYKASRRAWWLRVPSGLFLANYSLRLLRYAGQPIGVAQIDHVLHELFPRARIVGDKVPRYVFNLGVLSREPGLKRLMIYRDGRDVVSSMLVKLRGSWSSLPMARKLDSVDKIAAQWVQSVQTMEEHRASVYAMRYEDLVQQPRQTLDAMSVWLGMDPAGFQEDIVRETSIGKYRTGLTAGELKAVETVAGPTLARLNYI
jgi:hypothetical protein